MSDAVKLTPGRLADTADEMAASKAYQGHTGKIEGDADYEARGLFKITLRVPQATIAGLDQLAEERGPKFPRWKIVAELVAEAIRRGPK